MKQKDSNTLRLVSKVSTLYYLEGYKQQQIADRLNLSRPKVSRLLDKARSEGIVQISVVSPDRSLVELETNLEEKYGLEEVFLVKTNTSSGNLALLKRQIGRAAADHLKRTLTKDDIIGVSWGTTLQAMVAGVQPMSADSVHVVQILGGVGPPEEGTHATDLSRRLAQQLGSSLTLLMAPCIVDSPSVREVLLSDRHVKAAVELFPEITTAYVGIGALRTNPLLMDDEDLVPDDVRNRLIESDAVGDIALRFFDSEGHPVETQLDDRMLGITLPQLQDIERVVGIAGGLPKNEAIRGAVKGGLIDVLITDFQTANSLLEE